MVKKKQPKPSRPTPAPSVADLLARAHEQARAGKREAAQRQFLQASQAAPTDPAPQLALARLALQTGDLVAARDHLARADASDAPEQARLELRLAALEGRHRDVRALLAKHPDLVQAEPWAGSYSLPVEVPAVDEVERWRKQLEDARASGSWEAWNAAWEALSPALQPWAWQVALAQAATAIYVAPDPTDAAIAWLQATLAGLPENQRARFAPAVRGLAAYAAGLAGHWQDAARQLADVAPPELTLQHQRLLLALGEAGAGGALAPWRAWTDALVRQIKQHRQSADIEMLAFGLERCLDLQMKAEQPPELFAPIARLALTAAPDHPALVAMVVLVLAESNNLAEALRLAQRWGELAPDDLEALGWEADLRVELYGTKDALERLLPLVGGRIPMGSELYEVLLEAHGAWVVDLAEQARPSPRHLRIWETMLKRIPGEPARGPFVGVTLLVGAEARAFAERETVIEAIEFFGRHIPDLDAAVAAHPHVGVPLEQLLEKLVLTYLELAPKGPKAELQPSARRLENVLRPYLETVRRLDKPFKQLTALALGVPAQ